MRYHLYTEEGVQKLSFCHNPDDQIVLQQWCKINSVEDARELITVLEGYVLNNEGKE